MNMIDFDSPYTRMLFGKTIFLTKEEAVKALERSSNEKN